MNTFGPCYNPVLDGSRLKRQMDSILSLMLDGCWRTLHEISAQLNYPEASVSAQLRHLRKPAFGSYRVGKRRRTSGLWEYQLQPPLPRGQINLFDSQVQYPL